MNTINYETGIDYVRQIILGNNSDIYDRVYYSSNEQLGVLFSNVDLKNKDVLTVQASSDQLFHISNMEASSIDTFDINILTKYYYYLRKWAIMYKDEYYYDVFNFERTYCLLEEVIPKDEEEMDAYKFWCKFIMKIPRFFTKDVFYVSGNPYKNNIKSLEELKEFLVNYKLNFSSLDISRGKLNKKYDTIIISNILEYYDEDKRRLDDIRNNCYSMLNDNGEVIASHLMNDHLTYQIFSSFNELFDVKEVSHKGDSIGCVYKKVLTKNS